MLHALTHTRLRLPGRIGAALLALIAPLAIAGCGSGPLESFSNKSTPRFAGEQEEALSALSLTNQERAAVGAPPVTWHAGASSVAYEHSLYQRSVATMTHTGPGGASVNSRMDAGEIPYGMVGENVGHGAPEGAARIVQAWMESEPHRRNLLYGNWTHMGLGVTYVPEGPNAGPWWTQVFFLPE